MTNFREPSSSASRTFCFSSWRLPTMSWPSTPTTTTPLLSFFRVKRTGYPLRVCRMAIAAVFTISSAVAPRDRSEMGRANPCRIGPSAVQPLHEFVADVPGVEIGENQDVGATGGGRSRRLACRDGGHERGVELELSIEGEIGFARPQLGHTGHDPIDPRPAGAALRAIRKESDDGLVLDDQP